MEFIQVLDKMLVILFTTAVGYAAHHLGYLGGEVDQKLGKLLLNITMPAMILSSAISGNVTAGGAEILSLMKVSAVYYGLALVFVLLAPRFLGGTPSQKGAWRFSLAFSNVGFIGYPVAIALYGPGALFYASTLALPFNLLSFTLGPLMLVGKGRFQLRQMFSPSVVASLLALVCVLTGFHPPALVGEMVQFVGDVTVPLSLLVMGSLLAGLPARQVFTSPRIWCLTALRLLVMPVVLFFCLRPMGLEPIILGIAVTQMAMPVAVNGTLLSLEYGGDTNALAQATFLTTLVSMVTIPLIAGVFL